MSDEQEKKLDQLLEAVAKKYEVQAPAELPGLIEEALERKKPLPVFRVWQPAFAVLIVGVFSGVLLDRMRRDGLVHETDLSGTRPSPVMSQTPPVPEAATPSPKTGSKRSVSRRTSQTADSREAQPAFVPDPGSELGKSPSKKKAASVGFSGADAASRPQAPSVSAQVPQGKAETEGFEISEPEVMDGGGAKPYLISKHGSAASVADSRAAESFAKKPVAPPSYDEFMGNAARQLQGGNVEGALVYWDAALGLMSQESTPLPRALDIRGGRALLSQGFTDPVLRWLKALQSARALSLAPDQLGAWISMLERGEVDRLNLELEKRLEEERP